MKKKYSRLDARAHYSWSATKDLKSICSPGGSYSMLSIMTLQMLIYSRVRMDSMIITDSYGQSPGSHQGDFDWQLIHTYLGFANITKTDERQMILYASTSTCQTSRLKRQINLQDSHSLLRCQQLLSHQLNTPKPPQYSRRRASKESSIQLEIIQGEPASAYHILAGI